MTEKDELWTPKTWEKEDEMKMGARLEQGLGEVMKKSEGYTCTSILSCPYFLLLPTFRYITALSSSLPSGVWS